MKLYSEFRIGKKPPQVIAENGFHPELVENEYQRFLRFTEHDVEILQRRFFLHFRQDLLIANNNTINSLVEKYEKNGKVTIDEFITLITLMLNEKYQGGKASQIHDIINGIPPEGWEEGRCLNCNNTVRGNIIDPTKKLRITVLHSSIPLVHRPSCRV
jgi:hypothetical protein